jgi:hypothetical protein
MGKYPPTLISIGYPSISNNKIKMKNSSKCEEGSKSKCKERNKKREERTNNK